MAASIPPQKVADAFVKQYYPILKHCPEQAYKFYNDSSLLGWEGSDGLVTPVTTLSGIKDKIMSSDFRNCSVEIITTDFQASLEGGVIVAVNGLSTWNNDVKKDFSQTFFLAKQERVFVVMNDILRFSIERRELRTSSVANDDNKQDQAASSVPNAVATIASDSHAVNNKSVAKKKRVKQRLDLSVVKGTDSSKASTSKPSSPSHDKAPLAVKHVSVAKVEAPKPVEAPKISYASMVAKVSLLTSPKTVKISPNAGNRVIPASINKTSSIPSNVAPKTSSNAASKSSVSANNVPSTYSRVIYVANLPHDVTKNKVAEVMKKFGQVRRTSDSIQLRCYEDGFTYGFVEFQSADAAFRAVEAHNVQFGDKNVYITYKKRSNGGGNNGRGSSPSGDAFHNDHFRGYENGEPGNKKRSLGGSRTGYNNGQVRDRPRQNR